jgi:hypothetical protein
MLRDFSCPLQKKGRFFIRIFGSSACYSIRKSEISKNERLFMRYTTTAATCIVLLFCALFAGCTSPTQAEIKPVVTTVATTVPATTTPVAEVTTTFESVVALPSNLMVDLELTKDRPTGEITLLYNGGSGEQLIQSVRMRVTLPDGTVTDQLMNNGGQLYRGSQLVIQGTRSGSDHCEVWVTTAGKVYKTVDQNVTAMQ